MAWGGVRRFAASGPLRLVNARGVLEIRNSEAPEFYSFSSSVSLIITHVWPPPLGECEGLARRMVRPACWRHGTRITMRFKTNRFEHESDASAWLRSAWLRGLSGHDKIRTRRRLSKYLIIVTAGHCRHSSVGGGYYGRRRISNIRLGEGVPMSIRIDIRHASPPVQMNIRTGGDEYTD